MSEEHQGGCLCGSVRYRIKGGPAASIVCHCKACQHRTGSAFGVGVYFSKDKVELLSDELTKAVGNSYSLSPKRRRVFPRLYRWEEKWGGSFEPPHEQRPDIDVHRAFASVINRWRHHHHGV